MDFETAILTVSDQKDLKLAGQLRRKPAADHPRLWHARALAVAHRYEKKTGNAIPDVASFDWSTILDWLKANWKTIATILLTLLSLFL